ncbi:hypothetical protein FBULB1_1097 [Fusarium bulbicola]|nr:hypothetical protein FBULB1_1097 [Fusarium bulbicola]
MLNDYPSRCGICDRYCPNEKAIYLALRDIELIRDLGKKWMKKIKPSPGALRRTLTSIQDRSDVKALVDQYGLDTFQSVVTRLLKDKSFTSDFIAEQRFPGLTAVTVHAEAMSTEPAGITSEKSDWELLVAAEAPAKASEEEPEEATAICTEEDYIEDQRWLEEEPFTTEAYPAKAYEALAETKPVEVEEACGDRVQEEQNTICLPRSSQHNLIVYLQEVLETACFAYGKKQLATELRERDWVCVEAVSLHTWMNEFPTMTKAFNTVHKGELLRMKKLLEDALELTEVLDVKEYSDMVQKVRMDIGKAVEGLGYKEQEAEDDEKEKLERIAEERRKLDKCEVEVREYKKNRLKDYQKWAESEVEGVLEERRKTLETARFFLKRVD